MNKTRSISLSLSVVLLVSVFVPCFVIMPTFVEAQTPIKIGFFAPFTGGGLDFYAPWTKQGFELGMIYATTMMGYDNENKTQAGRPYELYYYDTQGALGPATAATLATTAIETDGIDILVGGTYSSSAAAIAPIAEDYQKLYFMTPAAGASLTAANFNPYIFRIARNNWHDAYAGVTYAMDTLNHTRFAFLAADYSFGRDGVASFSRVIEEKGGTVVSIQYASLFTSVWDSYMTALIHADQFLGGVDYLFVIWAGSFASMYSAFGTFSIPSYMDISGASIDIFQMNEIEASLVPPATLVNATGLCLYGYDLPNNTANDWMVSEYIARDIQTDAHVTLSPGMRPEILTFRAPELFSASGFATAQFLVDVTTAIPDLDSGLMINYLESGVTIDTPKGPTYLRPEDHQGLAEMYIAKVVNDTRPGSETENLIIAELVETLDRNKVAPPIESVWNGEPYVPGGFAPTTPTTTTTTGTTTGTTTDTGPPPIPMEILLVIGLGGGVVIVLIAVVVLRRR
ncbi:MAG: ABC transporter substrate-binding protein [Candidatus Thorarchaeota archaeon]|nr:MAG: ABC transporter substrate-binding protein [Candidatus Thorarchaeota archaeon]